MSANLSCWVWACLALSICETHSATIHEAVRAGNLAEVKKIVAANPLAVNEPGPGQTRPLHEAVPHPDIVEFLLARGARVNPGPDGDSTPLHLAVFTGQASVVRLLLQNGAEVNAALTNGLTPLHLAALAGRAPILSLLLPYKPELDRKDKSGLTPLHHAAQKGHLETVRLLLMAGADAKAKNRLGFKPSDLVQGSDNDALAELLEKAEAGVRPVPIAVVEELGDTSQIKFEGNVTFTQAALRNGLLMSPEFLIAAHFAGPRDEYLAALQRLVERGYRASGFPAPKVVVTLAESNILVHITEGRRYTNGAVKVHGLKAVPEQSLIDRLVQPFPPLGLQPPMRDEMGKLVEQKSALWGVGLPTAFVPGALSVLSKAVTNILGEFGLFFPRHELSITPQEDTGEAILHIHVLDEGPPGQVGEIVITGNKRDTRQELLDYLGLKEGMTISRNLLQQTEAKLWQSARFRHHRLTPELLASNDAAVRLKIDLMEYEAAPPLIRPLTPAEHTILRLRDWLESLKSRQEELVVSVTHETLGQGIIQAVLSQAGAAVITRPDSGQTNLGLIALFTSEAVGLFSVPARRRLVLENLETDFGLTVSVLPETDPEGAPFGLSIAGRYQSRLSDPPRSGAPAPSSFDLTLAPVAFLDLIHRPGRSNWIENGVLITQSSNEVTRVDVATGRLLDFTIAAGVRLSVQSNYLAQIQQQLNQSLGNSTNALLPGRPLSSSLGFLVSEVADNPWLHALLSNQVSSTAAEWTDAGRVVGTLLQQGILAPLDDWLQAGALDEENLFQIPVLASEQSQMEQLLAYVAAIVHRVSNDFFPQRSWPWTISREAVFVLLGQTRYTELELERLYESPDTGPIGFLAAAELLNLTTSPHAKTFAARGLNRLELEQFRKDCRLILEGDTPIVNTVQRLADAFASLSAKDLNALAAILEPEAAKEIQRAALLLRGTRNVPLPQRLQPLLDLLWEQKLKGETEDALQKLLATKPVQNASLRVPAALERKGRTLRP